MTAVPNLTVHELLERGYLLDLNLRWAHPLGLSFETTLLGGRPHTLVVRDRRREPGGATFDVAPPEAARKLAAVEAERQVRAEARLERLGSALQALDGVDVGHLAVADVPAEAAAALRTLARDFGAELALAVATEMQTDDADADACAAFVAWIAGQAAVLASQHLVAPLVGRLRLDPYGRLLLADDRGPGDTAEDCTDRSARVAFLLSEIGRLQQDFGQLYPEEVEEVRTLGVRASEALVTDDLGAAHRRLEVLFGFAQPGMRFFRGDKDARAAYLARAEQLRAEAEALFRERSEVEAFIAGDMAAEDLADAAAARLEIDARLNPARERIAALEGELAQLRHRTRPLESALDRLDGAPRAEAAAR